MFTHIQPFVSTAVAEEHRRDILRAAEQERILRLAGIPTSIDVVRIGVGRLVVRVGELIAGRPSLSREALPTAPVLPSTLRLAR